MTLSTDILNRKARALTGIDIEDVEVQEALDILVESLNRESHLTIEGEAAMEERLVRLLANRLRMERDFLRHPDIAEQRVMAPVFVFGLPRSGTTKMQKLLSVTGDFTELPFWMAFNPSLISVERSEKTDRRIEDAECYVAWVDGTSADVKKVHPFATYEPEEVNPILEQAFHSYYLPAFVDIPSYTAWEAGQDPRKQLQYLRRTLQYLQWQFDMDSTKPWALKNPTFVGMEPVILDVFPDAHLIMTHRHPSACVASSISLQAAFHRLYTDVDISSPDIELPHTAGYMLLEGLAGAMKQNALNRSMFPQLRICDISYSELAKDSIAAIDRVCQHIGKPMSEEARGHIGAWDKSNRQHKHGKHEYSLADFRLTPEMISDRFEDYLRDYSHLF